MRRFAFLYNAGHVKSSRSDCPNLKSAQMTDSEVEAANGEMENLLPNLCTPAAVTEGGREANWRGK